LWGSAKRREERTNSEAGNAGETPPEKAGYIPPDDRPFHSFVQSRKSLI